MKTPTSAATGAGARADLEHLENYGISAFQAIVIKRWNVDANLLVEVLA